MTTIALVQAAACRDLNRYALRAAEAGCEAVCFPEAFLTGYCPEEAESRAIPWDSAPIEAVSRLAQETGIDILAGFLEREAGKFYISQGIFRKDGTKARYRKTHLGSREKAFFTPGDCLPVFRLSSGLQVGFQLCMETHFPEITQTLALKGAQVIFAPHAVPRVSGSREVIWGKYIPARSYDNRVYMACCNLWDDRYGGGCLVTGPRGEVCASRYEDAPGMLVCSIDRALTASFRDRALHRSAHFYPAQRRRDLYL